MRIAVISDTHSRTALVEAALGEMARRGVDLIVHCGDIEDAATVRQFPPHTHFVFGNCDRDRDAIERAVEDVGATLHGAYGILDLEGVTLAFTHGDDHHLMRELEAADAFDFLFYGHTHQAAEHRAGRTRVINPGAIHRTATRTFLLLDVPGKELETVTVT